MRSGDGCRWSLREGKKPPLVVWIGLCSPFSLSGMASHRLLCSSLCMMKMKAKHGAMKSNTAHKRKNSSVKMIQNVRTSEITTCIWTTLLEHLAGIQPPCKALGRWAPSQVAGPFCPRLAAWTSEKLRRRWWRQSPSPKPHLWGETVATSDFRILYVFMWAFATI